MRECGSSSSFPIGAGERDRILFPPRVFFPLWIILCDRSMFHKWVKSQQSWAQGPFQAPAAGVNRCRHPRPLSWLSDSPLGPVRGFKEPCMALVQPSGKPHLSSCRLLRYQVLCHGAPVLRQSSGVDPILCSLSLGDRGLTSCSQGDPQGGCAPRGGVGDILGGRLF